MPETQGPLVSLVPVLSLAAGMGRKLRLARAAMAAAAPASAKRSGR